VEVDVNSFSFCFGVLLLSSLFVIGSHTKKRPNNLIFGRMFNHQLLDMFELGVTAFKGLGSFKVCLFTVVCVFFCR